jgi:transcriptional regulator with XRE-family HTH domain
MIDIVKSIARVEAIANKKKISIRRLCAFAGVSTTTWSRARNGKQEIRASNILKMEKAVESY